MGLPESEYPAFAHLPFVMGQDNTKLSKRNGEVSIAWYKDAGFLPEAICNYLALLGWSPGDDRENVSMQELCDLFTVERVNSSPARFDMKKLQAINGDKIRALSAQRFLELAKEWLIKSKLITGTGEQLAILQKALPIIQERVATLAEISPLLKFLFVKPFQIETESLTQIKNDSAKDVLVKSFTALQEVNNWTHSEIEAVLRKLLIDGMGLKPRLAFGPVRIAVTGSTVSPPLFESMELLGKTESLSRISLAVSAI
jgi:glutamyl-tRNA synthetase